MANPFFDAAYYLAQNPDVAAAGYTLANAEQHYNQYGAFEVRGPNPWFDARAYLAAYPDLAANGVTLANALAHYTTYGINENRSPAVNVNPADFTYTAYAANNPDLCAAFGISDPTHLTVQQQHELLAQFLSYGFHEGRSGVNSTVAGSFFTPPAAPGGDTPPPVLGLTIHVNGTGTPPDYSGGEGADTFIADDQDPAVNNAILHGHGATDTLQISVSNATSFLNLDSVENIDVSLQPSAAGTLSVAGSGVQTVTVNGDPFLGQSFTYQGDVQKFVLKTGANILYQPNNSSASTDHLDIHVDGDIAATFGVAGIEDFAVDFGASLPTFGPSLFSVPTTRLNLIAADFTGNALKVTLAGGQSGHIAEFDFNTPSSNTVEHLTIDGSTAVGNLLLNLDTNFANVDATLTGGSGRDSITAVTDIGHTTEMQGGAGKDTLTASKGVDIMSGGTEADSFIFDSSGSIGAPALNSSDGSIASTDTITDFASDDTLVFNSGSVQAGTLLGVGTINNKGIITFDVGFPTPDLTAVVDAIDTAAATTNMNMLFQFGADTYFLNTGATAGRADDTLVKLTGVNVANLTAADNHGVHTELG